MRLAWWEQVYTAGVKTITFLRKHSKWLILVPGLGLVYYSIASSLSVFQLSISQPLDLIKAINPTVIFPLSVLLKVLLSFWIMALVSGLMKPHRISQFGAKIFGVELSHKFHDDLQIAREGQEKLQRQIPILNDLNREILEYLSRPFEELILGSTDKPKIIRQMVQGILTKSYYSNCPQIKIQVIPLTEMAIDSLEDKISQIVMLLYREGVDITTVIHDKIGISIHHGEEDLGSAIIIDATNAHYDLVLAEICAAGTLFVATSTIVFWAQESQGSLAGGGGRENDGSRRDLIKIILNVCQDKPTSIGPLYNIIQEGDPMTKLTAKKNGKIEVRGERMPEYVKQSTRALNNVIEGLSGKNTAKKEGYTKS